MAEEPQPQSAPDASTLSGDDWAAHVTENPWPGNVQTEPGPLNVDDYESKFDRMGTERRVLGHITDLDHAGRGPRNTLERLDVELTEDPNTRYGGQTERLKEYLDALMQAGLVAQREDGAYYVTHEGEVELAN